MPVIHDEYRFFEISWVADPPDRTARFRLTLWQKVKLWAYLASRRLLRGRVR